MIGRPLARSVVNLSISESNDSARRGFPAWQVGRVTLQVTTALFGQGVSLVFGHDWREDGLMQAIHAFAQQVQPPIPLSSREVAAAGQPLLTNILPWPDVPRLSDDDLERLASTFRVQQAGLPAELMPYASEARVQGNKGLLYRYLRARGLTHLRHRLNAEADARLCLGGRREGSSGRYSGVIEEALLAVQEGKPLFLAGLLGGATRQVIDAIDGEDMADDFCRPGLADECYKNPPVLERDQSTQRDRVADRRALWTTFNQIGVAGISETNCLKPEENKELFRTPVLDRVVELVLTGLSRLKPRDG
jgi:hypothetical protein